MDPLGWTNRSAFTVHQFCVEELTHLLKQTSHPKPVTLVIDSLSWILRHMSPPAVCKTLQQLKKGDNVSSVSLCVWFKAHVFSNFTEWEEVWLPASEHAFNALTFYPSFPEPNWPQIGSHQHFCCAICSDTKQNVTQKRCSSWLHPQKSIKWLSFFKKHIMDKRLSVFTVLHGWLIFSRLCSTSPV